VEKRVSSHLSTPGQSWWAYEDWSIQ